MSHKFGESASQYPYSCWVSNSQRLCSNGQVKKASWRSFFCLVIKTSLRKIREFHFQVHRLIERVKNWTVRFIYVNVSMRVYQLLYNFNKTHAFLNISKCSEIMNWSMNEVFGARWLCIFCCWINPNTWTF